MTIRKSLFRRWESQIEASLDEER